MSSPICIRANLRYMRALDAYQGFSNVNDLDCGKAENKEKPICVAAKEVAVQAAANYIKACYVQ